MPYEFVLTEVRGPVGIVTINRPQVRNALNHQTIAELVDALDAFDRDDQVRCMILTGDDRAFAAGADISQMVEAGTVDVLDDDNSARWTRFRAIHKPVIAAVSGHALGGGCELALMCDLVVASESAQFGQPEVKIGIIPERAGLSAGLDRRGKYRPRRQWSPANPAPPAVTSGSAPSTRRCPPTPRPTRRSAPLSRAPPPPPRAARPA